jgi:hypothetical protein
MQPPSVGMHAPPAHGQQSWPAVQPEHMPGQPSVPPEQLVLQAEAMSLFTTHMHATVSQCAPSEQKTFCTQPMSGALLATHAQRTGSQWASALHWTFWTQPPSPWTTHMHLAGSQCAFCAHKTVSTQSPVEP